MSNVIQDLPDDVRTDGRGPLRETAPSVMREDSAVFARFLGMCGSSLVLFGGAVLIIARFRATLVGTGLATFVLIIGIAAMLFHAAFDREVQYRRLYAYFGLLALIVGAFLCVLPYPNAAGDQFSFGFLCLSLALLFELAVLRNETESLSRSLVQNFLLGAGAVMVITGIVGGSLRTEFLVPYGLVLSLLGLVYLVAYVSTRGIDHDLAYRTGQAIAAIGTLVFVIALGRSLYGSLRRGTPGVQEYLIPAGFILIAVGVLYMLSGVLLISENRYFVLIRRELSTFFYSPIAYVVLVAYTGAHWIAYMLFLGNVVAERAPIAEPIVSGFILQWSAIIATVILVPALTMRLFSEEHRSGTFEVLMTAPVSEAAVTVSKFVAALMFFLITWIPFGLLLIALRFIGGAPFDYRPLMSFFIGLTMTGAAFVSIGIFFSSLTKSQIGSAILTCVAMLSLTMVFLIRFLLQRSLGASSGWVVFLHHISYVDIWIDSLDGRLMPMYLMYQGCLTIFFLFLTVKVLESRRWV
jgi:ABC-type transport system involved in multi-copper enzyme maturation permease subunit